MLAIDGYSLTYDKNHNCVLIHLPQTEQTTLSTFYPTVRRRVDVSDYELGLILLVARNLFEYREGEDD